jgi:hypothetical protein
MKPPQCWIYPTGFNNEIGEEKQFSDDGTIKCKRASGWWVIDIEKKQKRLINCFKITINIIAKMSYWKKILNSKIKERFHSLRECFSKTAPKDSRSLLINGNIFHH